MIRASADKPLTPRSSAITCVYFFLGSDYRAKLADQDAVLGGGDLQTIARGLARVPSGRACVYSTVGQRIVEMLEHGGLSAEEEALVRGGAYVTAVCHTNTYVADTLTSEQRSGVLSDGVHLRLDDDWQGGGVWRAESPGSRSLRTEDTPSRDPARSWLLRGNGVGTS